MSKHNSDFKTLLEEAMVDEEYKIVELSEFPRLFYTLWKVHVVKSYVHYEFKYRMFKGWKFLTWSRTKYIEVKVNNAMSKLKKVVVRKWSRYVNY